MWVLMPLSREQVVVGYYAPPTLEGGVVEFKRCYSCTNEYKKDEKGQYVEDERGDKILVRDALKEAEIKINFLNGGIHPHMAMQMMTLMGMMVNMIKDMESMVRGFKCWLSEETGNNYLD